MLKCYNTIKRTKCELTMHELMNSTSSKMTTKCEKLRNQYCGVGTPSCIKMGVHSCSKVYVLGFYLRVLGLAS